MLRAIGFWITDIEDEVLPAPQEVVGVMPLEQRTHLADYLAAGMTHNSYLGSSWCRFGCRIDHQLMGSRDLTDGTWVWPEGLAHYVRHHDILLPQDFVDHASTRESPRVPGWPDDNLEHALSGSEARETIDHQYWVDWCAARRSSEIVARLRTIRDAGVARAQAESAAKYRAAVAKLIQERGLTDSPCIWKDCSHKALTDGYMCAEHSVNELATYVSTGPALDEFLTELSRSRGFKANFLPPQPSYATRLRTSLRRLFQATNRARLKPSRPRR